MFRKFFFEKQVAAHIVTPMKNTRITDEQIESIAKRFGISKIAVLSWIFYLRLDTFDEVLQWFENNSNMLRATPFVKWVGGKRQLLVQLSSLMPGEFNNYHEPFLWGGAVFFNIHRHGAYLSDANDELINVYLTVRDDVEQLISFLKSIQHSKETYLDIRAWDRKPQWKENLTNIERAWRFLYLNRTCFNGLHRVNSKGEFNVPIGKYENPDFIQEKNIRNVSELLRTCGVKIECCSFEAVLERAKKSDFVYLDPPYDTLSPTSSFTSYHEGWFGKEMQIALSRVYKELSDAWCFVMLSNHNTPLIRELYQGFNLNVVTARRNINSKWNWRAWVEEIIVTNYDP